MSVSLSTGTRAPVPAGLSPRTQELWLAAARYRRIADAIAAAAEKGSPAP
jgi:hypothetical protein